MYAKYEKQLAVSGHHYVYKEPVSLYGCNVGLIPRLLKTKLSKTASEPYPWHVNVPDGIRDLGDPDHVIVIDLMPNAKPPTLSLYELVNIWGYSSFGWTPIMFHLRALFVEEDPKEFNKQDFVRHDRDIEDPVFSMTYLKGTVLDGNIQGKWIPPGPSSTNSVLLWPKVFNYFAEKVKEIMGSAAR